MKSVTFEDKLASLMPGVWKRGMFFCGYKFLCQMFILKIHLRGHAEKTNMKEDSPPQKNGIIFYRADPLS